MDLQYPQQTFDKFVMCDAIDGAGKGVVIDTIKEWGKEKNLKIFDLLSYIFGLPSYEDLKLLGPFDMLFVAEPTHHQGGLGRIIRDEIIKKDTGRSYTAETTAHMYAADREVLYKTLVSQALQDSLFVVSDRGVITSEVYQPVQAKQEGYNPKGFLRYIRELHGNQYALSHAPGLLILPQISVEIASQRLAGREKNDQAIFENENFQEMIRRIYASEDIRGSYERKGTKVVNLHHDEHTTIEQTKKKVRDIWESYLDEKKISL